MATRTHSAGGASSKLPTSSSSAAAVAEHTVWQAGRILLVRTTKSRMLCIYTL